MGVIFRVAALDIGLCDSLAVYTQLQVLVEDAVSQQTSPPEGIREEYIWECQFLQCSGMRSDGLA